MIAEFRVSPQAAVDDVREALLGADLQPAVQGPGNGDTLARPILRRDHLLQLLKAIALSQFLYQ